MRTTLTFILLLLWLAGNAAIDYYTQQWLGLTVDQMYAVGFLVLMITAYLGGLFLKWIDKTFGL